MTDWMKDAHNEDCEKGGGNDTSLFYTSFYIERFSLTAITKDYCWHVIVKESQDPNVL